MLKSTDLRVITATNCDLRKAIEQGRSRLDLYYRLNVIQTTIPPLQDRKDDIIPLAQYFVALYNRKFRREVEGMAEDAVCALHAHTWPGNIRELRNTIERAMPMQDGAWIRATDLGIKDEAPVDFTTDEESSGDASLAEVERALPAVRSGVGPVPPALCTTTRSKIGAGDRLHLAGPEPFAGGAYSPKGLSFFGDYLRGCNPS